MRNPGRGCGAIKPFLRRWETIEPRHFRFEIHILPLGVEPRGPEFVQPSEQVIGQASDPLVAIRSFRPVERREDCRNGAGLHFPALRDELRDYFAALIPPSGRETMLTDRHGDAYKDLIRRIGLNQ